MQAGESVRIKSACTSVHKGDFPGYISGICCPHLTQAKVPCYDMAVIS